MQRALITGPTSVRISWLPEKLGRDLYDAAAADDVHKAQRLTASVPKLSCPDILQVAVSKGATNVASLCLERGAMVDDSILHWILDSIISHPIIRLLVQKP